MTTVRKRARQQRALAGVQKRQTFWEECLANGTTKVDGKTVDPEEKYLLAVLEESNLNKKGVK